MKKDRKEVCSIISKMLDSPEESGIFQTTKAYDLLETYIHDQRLTAIGWAIAALCASADAGIPPQSLDLRTVVANAEFDLCQEGCRAEEEEINIPCTKYRLYKDGSAVLHTDKALGLAEEEDLFMVYTVPDAIVSAIAKSAT